jgi:hypothetical protein
MTRHLTACPIEDSPSSYTDGANESTPQGVNGSCRDPHAHAPMRTRPPARSIMPASSDEPTVSSREGSEAAAASLWLLHSDVGIGADRRRGEVDGAKKVVTCRGPPEATAGIGRSRPCIDSSASQTWRRRAAWGRRRPTCREGKYVTRAAGAPCSFR